MTARGVDLAELLKDLRRQVAALEEDLRVRSDEVEEFAAALQSEYAQARDAQRTAATYGPWRAERVTQAAVAWVLATAFVRFCEDNELIEEPFIAGPGERLADAEERHGAFFQLHPQLNDRDWLIAAFDHLASTNPTVAGLFDRGHNPLWELTPSFEAATALLAFWRRRDADGKISYDFTDKSWNTRFLGDLYQDLSEAARKTYALLQTPEFVEEFILDLTLEPAIEEFGLAPVVELHRADGSTEQVPGLRTIDPACGSGHFLLGIFHRLLDKWRRAEPGADDWELIRIVEREFPVLGHVVRRPVTLRAWLRAYAAATSTTAAYNAILDAATPGETVKPAKTTTIGYRDVLAQLWMLEPVPGWLPTGNFFVRLAQAPKHQLKPRCTTCVPATATTRSISSWSVPTAGWWRWRSSSARR